MEKSWTTAELKAATSYSSPMLVELERRGVIRKSAKNRWPMPITINNIVRDLRARLQSGMSDSEARLREVKMRALQLKIAKEEGQVVDLEEATQICLGQASMFLMVMDRLPILCFGRADLDGRRLVEDGLNKLRDEVRALFDKKFAEMKALGNANPRKTENTDGEDDDQ